MPTSTASTTAASMSPCSIAAVGLAGRMFTIRSGSVVCPVDMGVSGTAPEAAAPSLVGGTEKPESALPGCSHCASATPMAAAKVVVNRMNPASRKPTARNCAPDPAPASPPTIDEKISGIRTIAISARNILPGTASQSPTTQLSARICKSIPSRSSTGLAR